MRLPTLLRRRGSVSCRSVVVDDVRAPVLVRLRSARVLADCVGELPSSTVSRDTFLVAACGCPLARPRSEVLRPVGFGRCLRRRERPQKLCCVQCRRVCNLIPRQVGLFLHRLLIRRRLLARAHRMVHCGLLRRLPWSTRHLRLGRGPRCSNAAVLWRQRAVLGSGARRESASACACSVGWRNAFLSQSVVGRSTRPLYSPSCLRVMAALRRRRSVSIHRLLRLMLLQVLAPHLFWMRLPYPARKLRFARGTLAPPSSASLLRLPAGLGTLLTSLLVRALLQKPLRKMQTNCLEHWCAPVCAGS